MTRSRVVKTENDFGNETRTTEKNKDRSRRQKKISNYIQDKYWRAWRQPVRGQCLARERLLRLSVAKVAKVGGRWSGASRPMYLSEARDDNKRRIKMMKKFLKVML